MDLQQTLMVLEKIESVAASKRGDFGDTILKQAMQTAIRAITEYKEIKYKEIMEGQKAKWQRPNKRPCSTMYECSECGKISYYNHGFNHKSRRNGIKATCKYEYCPWCGTKMEVEK